MAIKPCNLVLKNMNEKESSNSSEASTPEEYLTPSGESAFLSDTSAFSFPDLDSQHVRPLDNSAAAAAKLSDEVDNRKSINLDENLNQSKLKCSSVIIKPVLDSVDASNMNNNLDKHFQALERDIETRPTKLKPEKHLQPLAKTTKEAAGDGDLANVRKKLEERRRKMEMEKRRQELQWCQQRQAISKEAYSALFGAEADSEFHLSPDDRTKSLWNGKDGGKAQSSGYYRQDSAVAMEKLFANEESTDPQLAGGTLDRNFLKKQKSAREAGCNQPGRSTLDRKKTSSFKEASGRTKNAENAHGVDPNYGLSLDRLNSSLSELQGEIMRLSLQQDHIKNLVSLGDSPSHSSSVPTSHRAHGQGQVSSRQDPPISARGVEESVRSGAGSSQGFAGESGKGNQSARNSAFRRYSESRSYPRMGHEETFEREYLADRAYHDDLEEQLLNQQGNIPFAHSAVIPSVSPYPFLHPFHPPPYYPYAMNPYFHPYPVQPHYSLRSRPMVRNLDYRTRDGQLKRDLSLGGIPDLRSSSRRHEPPRRDSLSASRSAYTTSRGIGEHRLARPSSVVSDYFSASRVSSFDHRSSLDREAAYFEPRVARNPSFSGNEEHQSRRASLAFFVPDPADDSAPSAVAFPCDGDLERAADETATELSESDGEEEPLKSIQQPEFFVVNLEAAKRPKPEIGQRRSKVTKEVSDADTPSSSVTSSQQPPDALTKASSEKSKDVQGTSAEPENASGEVLVRSDDEKTESSSVGFVIEDSNFDPSISAEVEKKKNKLAELHQRRKEELAAKKNLISKDQQKKKEQLRLKEEKAQMKKSEEKQRRDLIFQKYLQRKSEMSETNSDDDSVKQFAVANSPHGTASAKSSSRLKPPSHVNKKPRPQSQLVVGSVRREGNSDFSDDCSLIITAVKQPTVAQEPKVPTSPDPRGFTDGRKPAQEKLSRFLSCGSEGEKVEDGSGLKLFVKPNQKSNRSIIINAVKDCCLAGVVNQDLKGKVLEEINRSESKHFVVLFRDAGLQYRGLYSFNPEKQEVFKIHGVGPRQLSDKMMEKFFKYNSGSKNFSEVTSTKHLTSTIDGVTILSCLWSRKQPANTTPRKNTT